MSGLVYKLMVETLKSLKADGVSREEVLDVLEFDSDEHVEPAILEAARDEVYGKVITEEKPRQTKGE